MEHYTGTQRNEVVMLATTCIHCLDSMPSERSQTQKCRVANLRDRLAVSKSCEGGGQVGNDYHGFKVCLEGMMKMFSS
jgi:hypothetical protein